MAGKGPAYIEQVFRWAHAADPDALLFYNDNGGETINPKSDAVYEMVQDFKSRGVPIDGVGLQMHVIDDLNLDFAGIAANIPRFTALGIQIHITERDVALPTDSNGNVREIADLARQAEIYPTHRAGVLCASRLHGHPDLGFRRQVLVDSLPNKRCERRSTALRSQLRAQARLRRIVRKRWWPAIQSRFVHLNPRPNSLQLRL